MGGPTVQFPNIRLQRSQEGKDVTGGSHSEETITTKRIGGVCSLSQRGAERVLWMELHGVKTGMFKDIITRFAT
ncbi:hypothetical protein WICPIJ_008878 [Wickerhamomyces pijperi]|uniref:Uncharacterized protein n=1 Tax=Wickerhamomyces pijperi TaxID=599730 RepID=A0A9P8TG19_WICPI|nr:hypothetical protein WICPIJ_008878 [Wickerhamomyces pijperi]